MSQASEQIARQFANGAINKKTWGSMGYNAIVEGVIEGGVTDTTAQLQTLVNKAIEEGRRTIFMPHVTNGQYYVTALTNADQVDFVGDNSSFIGGYTGMIVNLGAIADLWAEQAKRAYNKSIFAEIIDMHFQILRGVGFQATESNDLNLTKTITASAAIGARAITVNDTSNLIQGQLIVYYSNGQYYTNAISSIAGLTLNLVYSLEVAVTTSDTLHNFYLNASHANTYGFRAIADAALRNLVKPKGEQLYKRFLPTDFVISGTGSVANGGFKQDYTEPFGAFDTKVLTITSGQQEIATGVLYLERDMYLKFRTYVSVGPGATLNFQISDTGDTVAYYNKNKTAGTGRTEVIEAVTYLRSGSYNFKLQTTTPGSIAIGKTEVYELSSKHDLSDFNKGVHLCLGDSWFVLDFDTPHLINRLKERLPNATFLNYGVGGNEIENLIRRFTGTATSTDINNDTAHYGDRIDATVVPVIDYVWVMCGTNDYFSSKTDATFKAGMDDLMKEIIDRGAKPLIFTASVGQVGVGTNFTLSRKYADLFYNDVRGSNDLQGIWTPVLAGLSTPGSNTYSARSGTYFKTGNIVVVQFSITLSAKGAMAGALKIDGLPYAPSTSNFAPAFAQVENLALSAGYAQYSGFISGSSILLTQMGGTVGNWNNIDASAATNTTKLSGSLAYFV